MKIAILGAGVSGLAFYLFLEQLGITKTHEVIIYESRDTSAASAEKPLDLIGDASSRQSDQIYDASNIGGALGLGANGLSVVKRLDEELYSKLLRTGHVNSSWRLSNARGWTLSDIKMVGEEEGLMVLREAFWRLLRRRVSDNVIQRRKVVKLDLKSDGGRNLIHFENGEEVQVDLIVGADGIWSPTRKAMFTSKDEGADYPYAPHYEGLVGVGGYIPASKVEDVANGQMNVVFGRNGFFGYGYSSSDSTDPSKHGDVGVWWSTHSLNDCPDDWRNIDLDLINKDLKARHAGWKNKTVQNIVKSANVPHLWPTFTTPLLPSWSCPGAVLIGDAAHALQPSSGQGASMALEDAETLALLLAHHLKSNETGGLELAVKQYDEMRIPRVGMIHKKSQETASMKQDMNVVEEMVMYFFIWLMGRLRVNEKYQKIVQAYDVRKEVDAVLSRQK